MCGGRTVSFGLGMPDQDDEPGFRHVCGVRGVLGVMGEGRKLNRKKAGLVVCICTQWKMFWGSVGFGVEVVVGVVVSMTVGESMVGKVATRGSERAARELLEWSGGRGSRSEGCCSSGGRL